MYAKAVLIDRREMLRVKIKSLMEEARIIRREEQRTWGQLQIELHLHRIGIVRREARHTHLAYGFIRGLQYEQMEPKAETPPDWGKVNDMLKKYGPKNLLLSKDGPPSWPVMQQAA